MIVLRQRSNRQRFVACLQAIPIGHQFRLMSFRNEATGSSTLTISLVAAEAAPICRHSARAGSRSRLSSAHLVRSLAPRRP